MSQIVKQWPPEGRMRWGMSIPSAAARRIDAFLRQVLHRQPPVITQPGIRDVCSRLAEKFAMQGPFLEVGAQDSLSAILAGGYFQGKPHRFAINLPETEVVDGPDGEKIHVIRCHAHDMAGVFADGQFGTILCHPMLEHDEHFNQALDEMKRVLAPGGMLVIGTHGHNAHEPSLADEDAPSRRTAAMTLEVQLGAGHWRFGRVASADDLCQGLDILALCVVLPAPILVTVARKPSMRRLAPPAEQALRGEPAEDGTIEAPTRMNNIGGTVPPDRLEARRLRQEARKAARLSERNAKRGDSAPAETPEERRQRVQAKKAAKMLKLNENTRGDGPLDPSDDE